MLEISPEAYFDALVVANDAPASLVPMTVTEAHLFCYLGCILSLFRGGPISDWGYSFSVTSEGFPFSGDFEAGRQHLLRAGIIRSDENGYMSAVSDLASEELVTVASFSNWEERRSAIATAMNCGLAVPVGAVRQAVTHSPSISSAIRLGQRRQLLDQEEMQLIYDEYKVVNSVLQAEKSDVLSPGVIWLSARVLRNETPGHAI